MHELQAYGVYNYCSVSCDVAMSLSFLKSWKNGFHSALCLLQCTPAEFVAISKSLVKLMKHLQSNKEVATSKLESPLLRNLFTEVWLYVKIKSYSVMSGESVGSEKLCREGELWLKPSLKIIENWREVKIGLSWFCLGLYMIFLCKPIIHCSILSGPELSGWCWRFSETDWWKCR